MLSAFDGFGSLGGSVADTQCDAAACLLQGLLGLPCMGLPSSFVTQTQCHCYNRFCIARGYVCSQVRTQFRKIFTQMGFQEMPTNNYVESSFWNFDALFQPQQHPARDAHDTFFLTHPATTPTTTLAPDYLERVKVSRWVCVCVFVSPSVSVCLPLCVCVCAYIRCAVAPGGARVFVLRVCSVDKY